jgi:hypothetical protein
MANVHKFVLIVFNRNDKWQHAISPTGNDAKEIALAWSGPGSKTLSMKKFQQHQMQSSQNQVQKILVIVISGGYKLDTGIRAR